MVDSAVVDSLQAGIVALLVWGQLQQSRYIVRPTSAQVASKGEAHRTEVMPQNHEHGREGHISLLCVSEGVDLLLEKKVCLGVLCNLSVSSPS